MFETIITHFSEELIVNKIIKKEDKEIIVHGLISGIELVINIITTLALGFIFTIPLESLVFLISYLLIRIYAGGYHCKQSINCYIFSSGIVVLNLAIVKFTPKEYILIISLAILLISLPIILILAPKESEARALDEIERKYFRKKMILYLCVECAVVTILFFVKLIILGFVICLGIMISAIMILLELLKFWRNILCIK